MTKEQAILDIYKHALEMEEKGKNFYEKAIEETNNEMSKEIFTILRNEEIVHTERIKKIFSELKEKHNWNYEWKNVESSTSDKNLKEIFVNLAKKFEKDIKVSEDDIKALDIGIEFEQKAVLFYQEREKQAISDIEREFATLMVEEEKKHYDLLTDLKTYYSDPESYFMELDRSGLDGA